MPGPDRLAPSGKVTKLWTLLAFHVQPAPVRAQLHVRRPRLPLARRQRIDVPRDPERLVDREAQLALACAHVVEALRGVAARSPRYEQRLFYRDRLLVADGKGAVVVRLVDERRGDELLAGHALHRFEEMRRRSLPAPEDQQPGDGSHGTYL